ncbi:MAG: helix-turn-helix transcriptional regulator [Rhizobiales bacterium]|nr:helix-turn-helix transcriptional regulator [Hyphomicrobiales bacterium]
MSLLLRGTAERSNFKRMAVVGRTPKIIAETWIDTARRSLIEEGIAAVKVDRLAKRLGVTRGGFYHNFKDRGDLLTQLLHHWETTCHFLPEVRRQPRPSIGLIVHSTA